MPPQLDAAGYRERDTKKRGAEKRGFPRLDLAKHHKAKRGDGPMLGDGDSEGAHDGGRRDAKISGKWSYEQNDNSNPCNLEHEADSDEKR
ncbi:hypothetical protein [Tessaracoccus caeni]|uniref:hypothetical protein n=1 Tax=Tessaracoccus caeni TaxID=3031239 RepID=UPI0023DAFA27|nr:hypothetical protein [Tessaracoccus caeni]MDF1490149.1 hypothetical protein [Tessaracoccus caeni]